MRVCAIKTTNSAETNVDGISKKSKVGFKFKICATLLTHQVALETVVDCIKPQPG